MLDQSAFDCTGNVLGDEARKWLLARVGELQQLLNGSCSYGIAIASCHEFELN